jgi:hypothetical protein
MLSAFHVFLPIDEKQTKSIRLPSTTATHLPVAPQRKRVVLLPDLSATRPGLVVAVTLVETTRTLASGGETTSLPVLVNGVDNPVDARVLADSLVLGVNEDDLKVLVGRVLVDPVRVENAQVGAPTANTLLGSRPQGSLVLELVHSLVGRLACTTRRISTY